jgi:hypothetical protein
MEVNILTVCLIRRLLRTKCETAFSKLALRAVRDVDVLNY